MLLRIPLRGDTTEMRVEPERIEPRSALILRAHSKNSRSDIGVVREDMIRSNSSQRTFIQLSDARDEGETCCAWRNPIFCTYHIFCLLPRVDVPSLPMHKRL